MFDELRKFKQNLVGRLNTRGCSNSRESIASHDRGHEINQETTTEHQNNLNNRISAGGCSDTWEAMTTIRNDQEETSKTPRRSVLKSFGATSAGFLGIDFPDSINFEKRTIPDLANYDNVLESSLYTDASELHDIFTRNSSVFEEVHEKGYLQNTAPDDFLDGIEDQVTSFRRELNGERITHLIATRQVPHGELHIDVVPEQDQAVAILKRPDQAPEVVSKTIDCQEQIPYKCNTNCHNCRCKVGTKDGDYAYICNCCCSGTRWCSMWGYPCTEDGYACGCFLYPWC